MDNNKSFHYTYSVPKKNELHEIQKKYGVHTDHPNIEVLDRLKTLDQTVERPGRIAGISAGVIGILIFGTGMSMILTMSKNMFVPGIIIGILGLALIVCAYPLSKTISEKERKKKASEVKEICDIQ